MFVSVILAHPDPSSFNHAVATRIAGVLNANSHEVAFHDLYDENFPSILTAAEIPSGTELPAEIEIHCNEIAKADGIYIIHPNWWGQPPAILKGWVDRIIRPGVAYRFDEGDSGEGVPVGLLRAKIAVVINTANTPPKRESEVFGDPLQAIWKNCIFDLCGVDEFYRETFSVIVTSTKEQRRNWLDRAAQIADQYFPCC